MKVLYSVAAFGLLSCAATVAQARDFPGARVDVNIGWDHVTGKVSVHDPSIPSGVSLKDSTDGMLYGATVGYDVPVGPNIYAGIEASIDLVDNSRCLTLVDVGTDCFKLRRNLAVGARVGTAVSKAMMLYVGAAYVNGRATVSYTDAVDPTYDYAESDTRDGYRLSVGLEHRLGGMTYGKLEYRYSNYADYKGSYGTTSASLGFDRSQIVAGIGLRF